MLKFQGKVALITGSGTGIGQAIAKKFVENGASVIILGRRKEPLIETEKILQEIISSIGSNAFVKIFDGVDVSEEKGINQMFDSLKESNTEVDVIVNNAGVSGPVTCFSHANMDDFKSAVGIHLTGTFWTSVQALKVLKTGSKIITISTFFAEERPLEQRPYRFRSPYTASQGAKNRLAEAMSWELTEKGIVSIATNPGPVHSDRIYKTVYPKAASEFLRVSGYEDLTPSEVESINNEVVPLIGEDEQLVKDGIRKAAEKTAGTRGTTSEDEIQKLNETITKQLSQIKNLAEKIQNNTSTMIADQQFLSQAQVAKTVLTLADDEIAKILNGKVIPGDRVFYPVKPHIASSIPQTQGNFESGIVIITADISEKSDAERIENVANSIEKNGGKVVCLISNDANDEITKSLSEKFHSHKINLDSTEEIERYFNTAKSLGKTSMVIHATGNVPSFSKLTELSRQKWDELINKFIITPAKVWQASMNLFVPNGSNDPRLFKDKTGTIVTIGPDLPVGRKISGSERAKIEVFRGALRPFTTTVNQELSDVLKSKVRSFLVLPGTVDGKEPNNENVINAVNYFSTEKATSSAEVIFCPDESR